MVQIGRDARSRTERFIWLTGRVLEQRRFEYLFGDGTADAVLAALLAYRVADGGYGYGLEPDGRGPVSQPVHVLAALRVLDEIGRCHGEIVTPACDYLAAITAADGGVPITHPSIAPYPRAPWWPVSEERTGSLLPTAALVGLLRKNDVEHPWLEPATEFCWRAIGDLKQTHPYEAEAVVVFLESAAERDRAQRESQRIGQLVREAGYVLLDPDRPDKATQPPGYAPGEVHRPYDYAPEPSSLARGWFSDGEFDRALDGLITDQEEDGGWPIHWLAWAPGSRIEWRPWVSLKALKVLRAYGRLTS